MKISFRNSYSAGLYLAIMYYDPGKCGGEGGDWRTEGWWRFEVGQEFHVFSTNNQYFAIYAEADDGAHWSGDYGPMSVYEDVFDSCYKIGSTAAYGIVGLRSIDTGGGDYLGIFRT